MTADIPESQPKRVKGRTIVLSLILFGLVMSGSLYLFQAINTYHFADTQNALADAFPEARPRVEGGRLKGKPENPVTLRVTMAVPFNPNENDAALESMTEQVLQIVEKNLDLENYELAELHFYQAVPEQTIIMRDITRDLKDWRKNQSRP